MKNKAQSHSTSPSQSAKPIDPYQRFEASKIRNFQHSSRLEGIEPVTVVASLATVLAKYRQK